MEEDSSNERLTDKLLVKSLKREKKYFTHLFRDVVKLHRYDLADPIYENLLKAYLMSYYPNSNFVFDYGVTDIGTKTLNINCVNARLSYNVSQNKNIFFDLPIHLLLAGSVYNIGKHYHSELLSGMIVDIYLTNEVPREISRWKLHNFDLNMIKDFDRWKIESGISHLSIPPPKKVNIYLQNCWR